MDETGLGLMDCKRALIENNEDFELAKKDLSNFRTYNCIYRRPNPKWLFIRSDNQKNNEYLEYDSIKDYLNEKDL